MNVFVLIQKGDGAYTYDWGIDTSKELFRIAV